MRDEETGKHVLFNRLNSFRTSFVVRELSGLYFPFSRPLEIESLKQMLLVFDSVAFLDPVEDDEWRAKLLSDMVRRQSNRFVGYKYVDAALPLLLKEGAVQKYSPTILTDNERILASAAALSDLSDNKWVQFANLPSKFKMPHGIADDGITPTWQIFRDKLPTEFISGLEGFSESNSHIFVQGGEHYAWTVSYAAGSSIATNLHLAAAEQLGFAPVTDSDLHHRLLVSKAAKRAAEDDIFDLSDSDQSISAVVASMVLRSLVPSSNLKTVSFEQILRFREETKSLRKDAVAEISRLTENIPPPKNSKELFRACKTIEQGLIDGLHTYRNEMDSIRDRFWPNFVEAPEQRIAAGGLVAVALSFIGGPGGLLVGSLAAAGLSLIKTGLDLRSERLKVERSMSPAVAYLTRVQNFA